MTRLGYALGVAAALLMFLQAVLGRLFPNAYTDAGWVAATWIGNDWVTLLVATPLLFLGLTRAPSSERARALTLGVLAYGIYNETFNLFGAKLNAFLPLYALTIVCAAAAVAVELSAKTGRSRPPRRPRLISAYLMVVGITLSGFWLGFWGAFVFAGRATPIAPEAFKVVAATDLLLLVPTLLIGSSLLWMRHAACLLIGAIAAVQSALYLLVLTVNSALLIRLGFSQIPGELPIWGPLLLFTTGAALMLLGGSWNEVEDR